MANLHYNCRYPNSYSNSEEVAPERYPVSDNQVLAPTADFLEEYNKNAPSYTTAKIMADPVFADPYDKRNLFAYNTITTDPKNGKRLDRQNFNPKSPYEVIDGVPQNPMGLTGMKGRGRLGRLGPNQAVDPIVFRQKREILPDGTLGKRLWKNHKPVLELVLITRKDGNKDKALPGGMEESGDDPMVTAKKEFKEEAMNSLEATVEEKAIIQKRVDVLFKNAHFIGRFYVDDGRNTDNAWMQSTVYCMIDTEGVTYQYKLQAGDDAAAVGWYEIELGLMREIVILGITRSLYASHNDFVKLAYTYALDEICPELE